MAKEETNNAWPEDPLCELLRHHARHQDIWEDSHELARASPGKMYALTRNFSDFSSVI